MELSPEKQAEINERIAKSRAKYDEINKKIMEKQTKHNNMMKEGREYFHQHDNEIEIFEPAFLYRTCVAVMEDVPYETDPEEYNSLRYFRIASCTRSKKEEFSGRVAKGYLGYRLKSLGKDFSEGNSFATTMAVSKRIIGAIPFPEMLDEPNKYRSKIEIIGNIAAANFVAYYAGGFDLNDNKIPHTLVKAF